MKDNFYAGNITLWTDVIKADSDMDFAKIVQSFMEDVKLLPKYQELITRYSANITYQSKEIN